MQNSLVNTVATLTPPGRGAIGVIRIDGPNCRTALQSLFQPANPSLDSWLNGPAKNQDRIRYGKWTSNVDCGGGEDVILICLDTQTFEIHSHGGPQSRDYILRSLQPFGFHPQTALGEAGVHLDESHPVQQDPLNGSFAIDFPWLGHFGQELGQQLLGCQTERIARLLLQQPANWQAWLERVKTMVNRNAVLELEDEVAAVKKWNPFAERLLKGWTVVFAGPPNSGKSSLLNAMSGFSRAIVHESPGTTRDVVTQSVILNGWPFQLTDTAGQRESNSPIEMQGIRMGTNAWSRADCRVAVFDASERWGPSQHELLASLRPTLLVLNKSDLKPDRSALPPGIWLSAKTGENLAELVEAIIAATVPQDPTSAAVLAFSEGLRRNILALEQATLQRDWHRITALLETLTANAGL